MTEVELKGAQEVKEYLVFAIVSAIFNPVLGLVAIFMSMQCKKAKKADLRGRAIFYSDFSFGCSIVGIITTLLIIVLVYAFGHFPEHTYYDRNEIIGA